MPLLKSGRLIFPSSRAYPSQVLDPGEEMIHEHSRSKTMVDGFSP